MALNKRYNIRVVPQSSVFCSQTLIWYYWTQTVLIKTTLLFILHNYLLSENNKAGFVHVKVLDTNFIEKDTRKEVTLGLWGPQRNLTGSLLQGVGT